MPSSTNIHTNMLSVSIGAHRQVIFVPSSKIQTKIWRSFLLGGAAARIYMKICIACSHVGQMLFAGNKYLLLKRITVQISPGTTPVVQERLGEAPRSLWCTLPGAAQASSVEQTRQEEVRLLLSRQVQEQLRPLWSRHVQVQHRPLQCIDTSR